MQLHILTIFLASLAAGILSAPMPAPENPAVNFAPVEGAEVPELGEIFEGHKTAAEHAEMGIGY